MTNIIPFPTTRTTTASRRCAQVIQRHKENTFRVGESFTSADGVRVHVMDERFRDGIRELLLQGGGARMWAAESRFMRVAPEDGVA
jgi:hypothetical protein